MKWFQSLIFHFQIQIIDCIVILFREDQEPIIENSDCKICPICRKRNAALEDVCEDINIDGDTFYAAVVTHKPHQNATVTFSGLNLKNAILIPKRK